MHSYRKTNPSRHVCVARTFSFEEEPFTANLSMMAFRCEQFPVSTLSALVIYFPIKITGWITHNDTNPFEPSVIFGAGGCVRVAAGSH